MILRPPFWISGQAGKTLGIAGYSLDALDVLTATLTPKSLAADELTFSLRNRSGNIIPDDDQWITLKDSAGVTHFIGICKRSYQHPSRIFSYQCANAYQGMAETDLLENGRAYVTYPAGNLWETIRDLITRAALAGIPIQAPAEAEMPEEFIVPKMAFRSSKIATAIEDALKWAPDTSTRMDYSTTPPTLRFFSRSETAALTLELDAATNHSTAVDLTPYPEARALAVSFAYARRDGDNVVQFLIQSAGDDNAEARRKLSIYLSGLERSDLLVTEALTTAQKAVAIAQASVDAVGASIDAAAASAQIPLTWDGLKALDSGLSSLAAAYPWFSMAASGGGTYTLYSSYSFPATWPGTNSMPTTAVYLRHLDGSFASGWYPIQSGSFSPAELATAGATKATKYIAGDMVGGRGYSESSAPFSAILAAGGSTVTGWLEGSYINTEAANYGYRQYGRLAINISVDAINMAPAAVAAAVKAAAASGSSSFIERAEFVEAPPDLAANYFARQDWTPYKGKIALDPYAPTIPGPGDFLNVTGADTPAEWAAMKAPVAQTEIDLRVAAPAITIGPSPRMDFTSLVDRLRIPVEDNYQAG